MNLKSYAKLNLSLEILGLNQDNYHELESVFCYIDLYDEIEITESSKTEIESNYSAKNNIMLKAIDLFHENYQIKIPKNFKIKQQKNIPIEGGLGGGSSNAACILNYLYGFYQIKESLTNKISLAKKIGADVPFFLENSTKLIGGIGEKFLKTIQHPELPIILIKPQASLSTKTVFESLKIKKPNPKEIKGSYTKEEFLRFLKESKNSLTEAAIKKCPEIKEILNFKINNIDFIPKMTGSGSTCFYIFQTKQDQTKALKTLKTKFPTHYLTPTQICNLPGGQS